MEVGTSVRRSQLIEEGGGHATKLPTKSKSVFEMEEREAERQVELKQMMKVDKKKHKKSVLLLVLGWLNSGWFQTLVAVVCSFRQAETSWAVVRAFPEGCGHWWPEERGQVGMMALSIIFTWCALVWGASGKTTLDIFMLSLYIVWVLVWTTIAAAPDSFDIYSPYMCIVGALIMLFFYVVFVVRAFRLVVQIHRLPRLIVSKQKRRHVDAQYGFDLDLTYINAKLIAMGWPSTDPVEGQFRNQMHEVVRYFKTWHPTHYKVYNLCAERAYAEDSFEEQCQLYRFPDHNPCKMGELILLCEDVHSWLEKAWNNVASLHCKAGKGRTGMVICAYLLHSKKARTAEEAINKFGKKRTYSGKGVTIPSQLRYIYNYETVMKDGGKLRPEKWFTLQTVGIAGAKELGDWEFTISTHNDGVIFSSKANGDTCALCLEGDVKILVFLDGKKVFQFWFHLAYNLQKMDDDMPTSTPIWSAESPTVRQDGANAWYLNLKSTQLDMVNKKARKAENPLEISAVFVEADEVAIELAKAERNARGASQSKAGTIHKKLIKKEKRIKARGSERGGKKATQSREDLGGQSFSDIVNKGKSMKSLRSGESSAGDGTSDGGEADDDDQDLLNNLTDLEMLLSSLFCGYVDYTRNRCIGEQRRWCVLSIAGQLNIAGDSNIVTLNLAEKGVSSRFKKVKNEPKWLIKPAYSRFWESIQVSPEDEQWWNKAFSDAIRLGEAKRDPAIAFSGFFWKMSASAKRDITSDFQFTDWRIRLFLLRKDGTLLYHSWKDGSSDVPYCVVEEETIDRLQTLSGWACWDYVVPFTVKGADGKTMLLAGTPEDLDLLVKRAGQVSKVAAGAQRESVVV